MSRRPQLVEEGKPITDQTNNEHERYVRSLDLEYQRTLNVDETVPAAGAQHAEGGDQWHRRTGREMGRPSSLQSYLISLDIPRKGGYPQHHGVGASARTEAASLGTNDKGLSKRRHKYKIKTQFEIGAPAGHATHSTGYEQNDVRVISKEARHDTLTHVHNNTYTRGDGSNSNSQLSYHNGNNHNHHQSAQRPKLTTHFEITSQANGANNDPLNAKNNNANPTTNSRSSAIQTDESMEVDYNDDPNHHYLNSQGSQQLPMQFPHAHGVPSHNYYHRHDDQPQTVDHAYHTIHNNQDEPSSEEMHQHQLERMEIDEVHLQRLPMVVIDGANVAHAYVHATQGHDTSAVTKTTSTYTSSTTMPKHRNKIEPNVLGIQIAVSYFRNAGCRVQVVVPAYWMNGKKKNTNHNNKASSGSGGGGTATPDQMEVLRQMQEEKLLCFSPPTDDDDAYCITIARRIDARSRTRQNASQQVIMTGGSSSTSLLRSSVDSGSTDLTEIGGAFILSNDLFRDAMGRDASGDLRRWLKGEGGRTSGDISNILARRISYSFCDLGSMNRYGDAQLDFVPNPRHPLVAMVERIERESGGYIQNLLL